MSSTPSEHSGRLEERMGPTDGARPAASGERGHGQQREAQGRHPAPGGGRPPSDRSARTDPSPLALAAMAGVAVPGLDPARLALPQLESRHLRIVGLIDTRGRHWEVIQARTDMAGATLEAEAEVLRRIGRVADDGRLSFDVGRPAGSLRQGGVHIQVRSHIQGRALSTSALHPGPGLSAGLGRAIGELHELPVTVVAESGLPVYDADEVRERWLGVLDEAAATGRVPASLLSRWEQVLEAPALWRFRPTVVHGDLAEENILTAGGAVVGLRGLDQAHVGDPAEDLSWIYSTVPIGCLDSIEAAYDLARTEGVDKHLRERAELVGEMSLARWLLHGVRTGSPEVIEDAVSMLADLSDQVGDEPLVEPHEPRLVPVPGERVSAGPTEITSEIEMVEDRDEEESRAEDQTDGFLRLVRRGD